ncbi:MAG TPA: TraR/DksA C4-type zinc finger protein [Longimicrobiales bacterium]|nr:TraR/DksA C4-type zinc finger protein [Longimicrobiales bacterium]
MNDTERRHLEQRLTQERDRATESLDRYDEQSRTSTEDDGDLTQYKQHPADEGTDTLEQEKNLMLLEQESERLALIDAALTRLYKEPEQFGRCEVCDAEISLERLDVVPWTRFCVEHQEKSESTS